MSDGRQKTSPVGPDIGHSVSALVEAPAERVFAFLSDGEALGRWALGSFGTRRDEETGLYRGRSLFDGSEGFLHIDARRDLMLIDYHIGSPGTLQPRISARVVPHTVCGLPEDTCYATLTAWRGAGMDDARWQRLCATHEAEIWLIKAQIEAEAKMRPAP